MKWFAQAVRVAFIKPASSIMQTEGNIRIKVVLQIEQNVGKYFREKEKNGNGKEKIKTDAIPNESKRDGALYGALRNVALYGRVYEKTWDS